MQEKTIKGHRRARGWRTPVIATAAVGVIALTATGTAFARTSPAPRLAGHRPAAAAHGHQRSAPAAGSPSASPSSRSTARPRATITATAKAPLVYGSTVDRTDTAPPRTQAPARLPKRVDGTITATGGTYQGPEAGWIGGAYVMMHRGDNVTITGTGYLRVRYEIAWFNRPGDMVMPTWSGLRGKLFHVASGGQHRMDDPKGADPAYTWMGQPTVSSSGPAYGYVVLPAGAQQMWQNEFFYLDGAVTFTNQERGADYNITVTPVTWSDVNTDINLAPSGDPGRVRYGLVRDTGGDSAPVPQYLTRATTSDPAAVAQRSKVSGG